MKRLESQTSNNQILITVIMPVYNSEKYLEAAIESVLKQTYPNFELLLINDGSSDNSGRICDEMAKKDKRIRVIHKKNEGVCCSRNLGIDLAMCKYLSFIDNDDEYDENYLKKLTLGVNKNYDVIKCGRMNIKINEDGHIIKKNIMTTKSNKTLSIEDFINDYYNLKMTEIWGSVWNGLYRTRFLKKYNVKFDEELKHGNEDLIFNYQLFLNNPSICVYSDILYKHYYRIKHSTSMNFYEDQIISRIKAIKLEKKLLRDKKTETVYLLTEFENIRECFKILTNCKDRKIRKKMIQIIEYQLDFSVMKKIWAFHKELNYKQLIDFILLKNGLYNSYFFYKTLQCKLGF